MTCISGLVGTFSGICLDIYRKVGSINRFLELHECFPLVFSLSFPTKALTTKVGMVLKPQSIKIEGNTNCRESCFQ